MFPKIPKEWRDVDGDVTLKDLNDMLVDLHILSIVIIVILMIVGVVGNILSIYVFTTRYESSTHRYFILWMAWIDLVSCAVGKPLLLVSLFKPYMFPSEAICKTGRFLHIFLVVSSALIVVAIAAERHRRICSPFSLELTTKKTLIICILATAFGCFMAIPAIEVYGEAGVETGIQNLTGYECFVEPAYQDTPYPMIYFSAQLFLAFGCIVIIAILYSRTVATLWFHLKFRRNNAYTPKKPCRNGKGKPKKEDDIKQMNTLKVENDVCHSISNRSDGIVIIKTEDHIDLAKPYVDEEFQTQVTNEVEVMSTIPEYERYETDDDCFTKTDEVKINAHEKDAENKVAKKEGVRINLPEDEAEDKVATKEGGYLSLAKQNSTSLRLKRLSTKHRLESSSAEEEDKSNGQSLATKQVTMMFFLITVVFVISFIPHLFLLLTVVLNEDFLDDMSPTGIVVYSLFLRSFVINNMANPIIYAFCDKRFRSECADAVMVLFTCGRYLDWTK